jgi:hypothetical protein
VIQLKSLFTVKMNNLSNELEGRVKKKEYCDYFYTIDVEISRCLPVIHNSEF